MVYPAISGVPEEKGSKRYIQALIITLTINHCYVKPDEKYMDRKRKKNSTKRGEEGLKGFS